jgi:hypothetical protein
MYQDQNDRLLVKSFLIVAAMAAIGRAVVLAYEKQIETLLRESEGLTMAHINPSLEDAKHIQRKQFHKPEVLLILSTTGSKLLVWLI